MPPEAPSTAGPTASRSRTSLSVILPGLNEEASVEPAVARTRDALERLCDEFEILIINDGSTDRTSEIAERLAEECEQIRVLHNERKAVVGLRLAGL